MDLTVSSAARRDRVAADVREALATHFVMWHDMEGGGPPGEWRCACGLKFGFSDSAIGHVAGQVVSVI